MAPGQGKATAVEFAQAKVKQALAAANKQEQAGAHRLSHVRHPTKVSPWLELTRWPEYLRGQDLATVVVLAELPDPATKLLLVAFADSMARLINCAYHTIRNHWINKFD
ncbi:hypothetical protein BDW69DRAFT_189911 [Aspergillus filifer]